MPTSPAPDVIDAINAPVTSVSRRIEIFEADGYTPWRPDDDISATLLDGTVSVDQTRDERRNIDLTLDNSSGILTRDPRNGFWYDKVIKTYRGVEYSASSRYVDLIQSDTPALYVRLDNNASSMDLSPRGVPMRRFGYPVPVPPLLRSPDAATAVRSVDVSSYMATDDLLDLHPATTATSWTIEAWVRPLGLGASWGGHIFGRNSVDQRIAISSAGVFQALIRDGNNVLYVATSPTPYVSGNVYHVAATSDGATMRLYVNGDLVASKAWSGVNNYNLAGFSSGGDSSGQRLFQGDVSECAFYIRPLSQNELKRHYISGVGRDKARLTWEAQTGEFLIDKIDEARFPSQVKVTGRDYAKRCLLAKLPVTMSFGADTPIEDLVRSMAANAGITKFILPPTGLTVGSGADFDQGTERWNVMKKICEANAYELFFNPEGYLVLRPSLDPSTGPISLTLQTGPKGNLVDWTKSSVDTEVFNRVICVSDGSNSILPYYGEASNTDPGSPTSIKRLGERTWIYTSAFFTSNAQCVATAKQFLAVKGLESFNVDFSSLVFPWTEAGEIVEFIDPVARAYDPTRFLLSSFSLPVKLGPMTGSAKRIIIVK